MKFVIESKTDLRAFLIKIGILLITFIVFAKNLLTAETVARKTRPGKAIIEAINLTKPVIKEVRNFLIEEKSFEKKLVMEDRTAKILVLTETMTFLIV